MNKRIRKKQSRIKINRGDYLENVVERQIIFDAISTRLHSIKDVKLSRPKIRALINYMRKHRKQLYTYKHSPYDTKIKLNKESTLRCSPIIVGGKNIKYKSSLHITFEG